MSALLNLLLGLLMSVVAEQPAEVKNDTPPEQNNTSAEIVKEPAEEEADTYKC